MNDPKLWLLEKVKRLKEENEAILKDCEAKGRDMTDAESVTWRDNMKRVEEHLVEVKKLEDLEGMQAQMDRIGAVTELSVQEPTIEVKAGDIGNAFTSSQEYKTLRDEFRRTGVMPKFNMPPIELKAAGDAVLISDGSNADAIRPGWDPTLYAPSNVQFPLRVGNLLGQSQAEGNVVHYPVVATRTGPSGNPTAEGAAKKGVIFAFDDGTVTLEKNTAFGGASDEMFADAPVLTSYMRDQIGFMVDQAEETAIVAVLYAALSTKTGSGIAASPNGFDAIREAMAAIEVNGGVPDGIVIHPNDAAFLDVLRSVTGDQYYSGGPVGAPRDAWWGGLRLVKSTYADPGRPIVGAFKVGGTLYTRGGTTVETSNSHASYFSEDKVAIRAYRRSKAVKHYPEWFFQCDIGAS